MPYSYLIESNGTHAFMMNGTTHQMEMSSTDTGQLVNLCAGNITGGGTIQFSSGNFTVKTPIAWTQKAITLKGEGSGSWSTGAETKTATRLVPTTDIGANPVITMGSAGVNTIGGGIQDLTIDAFNNYAGIATILGGIKTVDLSFAYFANLVINGFRLTTPEQYGVLCTGANPAMTHGNVFVNVNTHTCYRGFYLGAGGSVDGYHFESCMNHYSDNVEGTIGVLIDAGGSWHCDSHKFFNHRITALSSTGCIGIYIDNAQICEFYGTRFESGVSNYWHINLTSNATHCKFFGGNQNFSKVTDNGEQTRWNNLARESLGGSAPTDIYYRVGEMVQDTDNPTKIWILIYNGTWIQIA